MWVSVWCAPARITMECSVCHEFLELEAFRPHHPAYACRSCEAKVAGSETDLVACTQPGAVPADSRGHTAANQPTQDPNRDPLNMRRPTPATSRLPTTPQSPNVRKSEQLRRFLRTVHEPRQSPTYSSSPEANAHTQERTGP